MQKTSPILATLGLLAIGSIAIAQGAKGKPTPPPVPTSCASCKHAETAGSAATADQAARVGSLSQSRPDNAACSALSHAGKVIVHTVFNTTGNTPNGDTVTLWMCAQSSPRQGNTPSVHWWALPIPASALVP